MTFDDLQKSLAILGLGERATADEIRRRHRELVRRHHPDACGADTETIRLVNEAYRVISAYCSSYSYSFTLDEFLSQNPEERLRLQFTGDPWFR